jgi:hypothetical protein
MKIRCRECSKGAREVGSAALNAWDTIEIRLESRVRIHLPAPGGGTFRLGRTNPFPQRSRTFRRDELEKYGPIPFECPDDGQVWVSGSDVLVALDAGSKSLLARRSITD